MALILNIDTAQNIASVCVSEDARALAYIQNENQKEHASFLHDAVASVLNMAGVTLESIDAFAVTSGPGSYTGVRVGMATAKGFCYALSKPLIAINTLEVMAKAAIEISKPETDVLFCPMIDAQRMEVFLALYDGQMKTILPPKAQILDENLFNSYLEEHKLIFFGSGSLKFKDAMNNVNSIFLDVASNAKTLGSLAAQAFKADQFADISYVQPDYCKDVYIPVKVRN